MSDESDTERLSRLKLNAGDPRRDVGRVSIYCDDLRWLLARLEWAEKQNQYMSRVLSVLEDWGMKDQAMWHEPSQMFVVITSDVFAWACADVDDRPPDALYEFVAAINDCEKAEEFSAPANAVVLYATRRRKCLPQEPLMKILRGKNPAIVPLLEKAVANENAPAGTEAKGTDEV